LVFQADLLLLVLGYRHVIVHQLASLSEDAIDALVNELFERLILSTHHLDVIVFEAHHIFELPLGPLSIFEHVELLNQSHIFLNVLLQTFLEHFLLDEVAKHPDLTLGRE
jgi:hypothetical protein